MREQADLQAWSVEPLVLRRKAVTIGTRAAQNYITISII